MFNVILLLRLVLLLSLIFFGKMRIAALISGGKDSCFATMCCLAAGHEVVALANMYPNVAPGASDDLDSFMYQTVGHEAVAAYAAAFMDGTTPLYRHCITGQPLCQDGEYKPESGDEVEDLRDLLAKIVDEQQIEGICCGAVLSNYQKVRVENICARLGIKSLAPMWEHDQVDLVQRMISSDIDAILVKVAACGLIPKVHLSRSLSDMLPILKNLNEKFGLHVCGEGGEFESFVLDCPTFSKRIVIDETEIKVTDTNSVCPVGYLKLKKLHLEEKPNWRLDLSGFPLLPLP